MVIEINKEIDPKYEACKILRQYPKDTVILNNIKGIEKIPEIYRKEPENINKDEFDELSL